MMSASITESTELRASAVEHPHQLPRLSLKPPTEPASGHVDGGWWPRSRDLAAELPTLLAVLTDRLGPVERVSYNLGAWGPTVRKIRVDGALVRLAGYHSQHADTVDVLAARHRLTLLVVPPQTTAQVAHRALERAGQPGNGDPINELLEPTEPGTPGLRGAPPISHERLGS